MCCNGFTDILEDLRCSHTNSKTSCKNYTHIFVSGGGQKKVILLKDRMLCTWLGIWIKIATSAHLSIHCLSIPLRCRIQGAAGLAEYSRHPSPKQRSQAR